MKKILYLTILLSVNLFSKTIAQEASIFQKGEVSTTDNHTGTVWLKELSEADNNFNYSLAFATFAPTAKLDWHSHPAGQVLLITEGTGYYQEKGKPIQVVHKGDVIKCLPGIEHWHGASPGSTFSYIGATPTQNGKTVWARRVTEEEYNSVASPVLDSNKNTEQEIIDLSKNKWRLMADKNVEALTKLFDDKAVFVHMGGSWGKDREIEIIKNGDIHYKKADIHEVSVKIIDNTAILLNRITLLVVVGGNEPGRRAVTNQFMVTEVYVKQNGAWKMGSLSFTKLMMP